MTVGTVNKYRTVSLQHYILELCHCGMAQQADAVFLFLVKAASDNVEISWLKSVNTSKLKLRGGKGSFGYKPTVATRY